MKLGVVILNWNGKAFLERFLTLVKEHSPSYTHIVVADNASTDDSLAYLEEQHPDVSLIRLSENLGYAGGYNEALSRLDADFFVLLNSDVAVGPGWVEPVLELMEQDEGIAACQPKLLSFSDPSSFEYAGAAGGFLDRYGYPFCRGRVFETIEKDTGQYNDTREVFWASGACLFIRASAFRKAGGFDTRFFAHMEEIDLCWRLKQQGYKIMVCPASTVWHVGGGTLPKSNPRKTFLNFRNSLWLLAKNLPARYFYPAIMLRLALDELAATRFLFQGNVKDCLAVFKAQNAFFRTFLKMRKESQSIPKSLPSGIYRKSIVLDYFLKKKKYFTDILHP